jgi:hypothetical protein
MAKVTFANLLDAANVQVVYGQRILGLIKTTYHNDLRPQIL